MVHCGKYEFSIACGEVLNSLWMPRKQVLFLPHSRYWIILCRENYVLL